MEHAIWVRRQQDTLWTLIWRGGERVKDWYGPKGQPDEPEVDDPAEDEATEDQ